MVANEITEDEVVEPLTCGYCSNTGEDFNVQIASSGENICNECGYTCERCGELGTMDDNFHTIDGGSQVWCGDCTSDNANYCNYYRHQEYHTQSEYYLNDQSEYWCSSCCESWASWCENCDEYSREGCDDCENRSNDGGFIHDYSYKPDPIFHSTDTDNTRLYFGIEIEIEASRSNWDTRQQAAEYAYRLEMLDLAYLKGDGSLNCGFEIVTHPMTHAYFKNEAQELWVTTNKLKDDMNMKSWSMKSCGLHIHMSRLGFGGGAHQHRFLQLVYHNKDFYSALAGRESDNWAKFTDVVNYRTGKPEFANKIKNYRDTDRYSAVNTMNHHTLEMRIFKGSLNEGFIKSTIDLAHASVEYTRKMSLQEIKDGAFSPSAFTGYVLANADLYSDLIGRMSRVGMLESHMEG